MHVCHLLLQGRGRANKSYLLEETLLHIPKWMNLVSLKKVTFEELMLALLDNSLWSLNLPRAIFTLSRILTLTPFIILQHSFPFSSLNTKRHVM